MNDLQTFLKSIDFNIEINFDGEFHRFDRAGSNTGWYKGKRLEFGGTDYFVLTLGDWKTGEQHEWTSTAELSAAQKKEVREYLGIQQKAAREAREREWLAVAELCEKEFAEFSDRGTTPYLTRKQIPNLMSARIMSNANGDPILVVPCRDVHGKLWNYQRIYSQKLSAGDKFFCERARIEGLFFTFGELKNDSVVYVAEGFATAASIRLALPECCVVAAFNANNLLSVCEAIKSKYPTCTICLCADDDAYNSHRDGTPYNAGMEKGRAAIGSVGGLFRYPIFKRPMKGLTDFNDLHCAEGLEMVKDQILHPGKYVTGIQPMCLSVRKSTKQKIPPTEKQISDKLIEHYDGKLLAQGHDLWAYTGTHWRLLTDNDVNRLKQQISTLSDGTYGSRDINAAFAYFMIHCPAVPNHVNLFEPNRTCGNFLDGTLRLARDAKTNIYSLSFGPHSPSDFITWVVPVNYQIDRTARNPLLDGLVAQAFEGDPDGPAKVRALKQLAGAMLVPTFPQLVFCHGVSGSRKSTIIKTLAKLLHKPNVSWLDPCNMQGFEVSAMIGKLVNINTDIDDHTPLPRGFLKRFEDGLPFHVNRKNKDPISTVLPGVQVYCANFLPPNFEGASRAMFRRVTLIEFTHDLTNDNREGEIKFYEDVVFAAGYEGILNFALEGLEDLIKNGGKFCSPESSRQGIGDWQQKNDPITNFLEEISKGEVFDKNTRLFLGKEAQIERKVLWSVYSSWVENAKVRVHFNGKLGFFSALKTSGIKVKTIDGVRYFEGIGLGITEGACA